MSDTPILKDLLTVPCDTCNDGWIVLSYTDGRTSGSKQMCPDCGGRGWQPAEIVQRVKWCAVHKSRFWGGGHHGAIKRCEWSTDEKPPYGCEFISVLVVPLSMLEGR